MWVLSLWTDRESGKQLAEQVEEACSLLAEYNSKLTQELEDRKQVSQMLANFTFHQRELMALAEQKLEVGTLLFNTKYVTGEAM